MNYFTLTRMTTRIATGVEVELTSTGGGGWRLETHEFLCKRCLSDSKDEHDEVFGNERNRHHVLHP